MTKTVFRVTSFLGHSKTLIILGGEYMSRYTFVKVLLNVEYMIPREMNAEVPQ